MIQKRAVIFAEGEFTGKFSKTARGILKYGSYEMIAVIDSTLKGKFVHEFLPVTKKIPFVGSLKEVLNKKPEVFILGIAPRGGQLPPSWREVIEEAIDHRLDIYNGLHLFLGKDEALKKRAEAHKVTLWDSRAYPEKLEVATAKVLGLRSKIILTIGTDCAIGKMTATYELHYEAQKQKFKSVFIPTGQTAIMIEGRGISIDAVPGDFMAGACEKMILDYGKDADYIFVEGQGSLSHLGYSNTSLALLHGSLPTHLVLCHDPSRNNIKDTPFPLPTIERTIKLNEMITPPFRKAKVCGISLNTSSMDEMNARKIITEYEQRYGLPTTDAMRFGVKNILDAITKTE